jgi:hypothetical protein
MSAGGINVQQPIVGMPPNAVAATNVGPQPNTNVAWPATAATPLTSPAATTPTAYVPVAGQDAGSVQAAGGLVSDGSIPRTAAIAAGLGGEALQQQGVVNAAQGTVSGQQVVDPSAVSTVAGAQNGPAAWSDEWATKFKEAGAPSEIIQQLTFTGAMGADATKLQAMLDEIKGQIDTQLAQFAHEHPDAFKKLRGNKAVDRGMIAQIATASNAGQLPEADLEQMVDSVGKSQGKMLFDTLVKPMIVWSLIPGWGALRIGFSPFTGGKDILTGEKLFGDPMSTAFTIMAGVGGGMTLWNNARGAMQVAQGHRMIGQAGSDAAQIAAREGLDSLSLGRKVWSYVPGTQLNQQVAGLSRLDDVKSGISNLKGIQQELAQNAYNKVVAGDALLWGESASKWTKMGYQPNNRGFLMGHIMGKKSAASIVTNGTRPTILLDGRTTGKVTAAQFAALGVDLADDAARVSKDGIVQPLLKSRMLGDLTAEAGNLKNLKALHLGQASQQLFDAGAIVRPTGINKILGAMRPGPIQDSMWAADNLANKTLNAAHGWAAVPKLAKFGLGGLIAAGAGYMMIIKPKQDMAKAAEAQAAEQAAAQQQAGSGGGAIDPTSLSAEDQAVLQQFAAMPPQQQAQIIQQQYAQLQQALQTPNLTAEQQQQVAAAQSELQLLMQVAGTNGGGAATPAPATQAPGAATAPSATPSTTGGFTAQGLGLAP